VGDGRMNELTVNSSEMEEEMRYAMMRYFVGHLPKVAICASTIVLLSQTKTTRRK
jgi:hypothetical protein